MPQLAVSEPGLRERKKAQQRDRIVDETVRLVRERGYDGTTVEEIVRRLEISQPTFYNYFPSKDAVLVEVARRSSRLWSELVRQGFDAGAKSFEKLERVRKLMADWIAADKPLWRAIVRANALNALNHPELKASEAEGLRLIEEIIEQGQRRGEITKKFSASRLTTILEGMQFLSLVEWAADYPTEHSLDRSLRENFEFFLEAAGVKGHGRAR